MFRSIIGLGSSLLTPSLGLSFQRILSFPSASHRWKSFFKSKNQNTLWKSNTRVSNQGQKRGRAKGLHRQKNLNRYQLLGVGREGKTWMGLNSKLPQNNEELKAKNEIKSVDPSVYDEYSAELIKKRTNFGSRRRFKESPLSRGWTGGSKQGKKFGAPLNAEGKPMENFESILLESKYTMVMTGLYGRVRSSSTLMVTGNKNGMVGFSLVRAPAYVRAYDPHRVAMQRASKKLFFVHRYENRTVYHDFFTQFGSTKIFVKQKPPGSGVKAHRIISAICSVLGISDLYAKIEGAVNPQHITKAFLLGLLRQRTHQDMANEKGLHLIEMREENGYFPKLIASPSNGKVRTKEEILPNEILDYEMIAFEGNLPYYRPERRPFYEKLDSYKTHLIKTMPFKHYKEQTTQMLIDYGEKKSHLSDKYPECTVHKAPCPSKDAAEE